MLTLVRRARRRLFHNELLFQGANAGSAALLAFILLMLLGTQILRWEVALLIPLAAAGAGLYVARQRVPPLYRVAQMVDRRLTLADTLSTAFFFSQASATAPGSPEIRKLQLEEAERKAASIDPCVAIPYSMPRSIYAMAALTLVAASLFGLRYGLTRSLDLHPPLVHLLQQAFGSPEKTEQAKNSRKTPRPEPASPDDNQSTMQEDQQEAANQDPNQSEDVSDSNAAAEAAKDENKADEAGKKEGDEAEQAEADQNGPGEDQGNSDAASKNGQSDANQPDSKQDGKADANHSSDNSSLMEKLKDFAQNLMSKVKPPSGGQQASGEQNSKQGKGQQSAAKQQQSKDGQKQNGQAGDPQEGQPGDQAESSQDPEGKGTGKNDSKQLSKQPGSGVGNQDGEKRIRQAEQLAAMGKISEIIGKRSATVTGEATVEVKSTSQQIHTPYAQRGAQHSQGGTEINRDEVPVALESFVEHYFEQVRKQAPPAPPKK